MACILRAEVSSEYVAVNRRRTSGGTDGARPAGTCGLCPCTFGEVRRGALTTPDTVSDAMFVLMTDNIILFLYFAISGRWK
jgi:hypothetical protein